MKNILRSHHFEQEPNTLKWHHEILQSIAFTDLEEELKS